MSAPTSDAAGIIRGDMTDEVCIGEDAAGDRRRAGEIRRFELRRDIDVSGVSGTGVVAEGVEFTDGTVALRWLGKRRSTVIHEGGIGNVRLIHGHRGDTRIVFLDNDPDLHDTG